MSDAVCAWALCGREISEWELYSTEAKAREHVVDGLASTPITIMVGHTDRRNTMSGWLSTEREVLAEGDCWYEPVMIRLADIAAFSRDEHHTRVWVAGESFVIKLPMPELHAIIIQNTDAQHP